MAAQQLPRFAAMQTRVNAAAARHLTNALLQLQAGGPAWAAMYDTDLPDSMPFADVATAQRHSVRVWGEGMGALCEGADCILTTAGWPAGQPCRVSTPVELDADGWAVFDVVPL